MAFQKAKTTTSNVSGNYWRIDDMSLPKGKHRVVVFNLYKDEASAQPPASSPMQPAQQYLVPESAVTVTQMNVVNSNPIRLAYLWVKANVAYFFDAIDLVP